MFSVRIAFLLCVRLFWVVAFVGLLFAGWFAQCR